MTSNPSNRMGILPSSLGQLNISALLEKKNQETPKYIEFQKQQYNLLEIMQRKNEWKEIVKINEIKEKKEGD